MIEASRIDHASHANDRVAYLHDVLEDDRLLEYVKQRIDEHPDTATLSVADHETGGLTLPDGWDPRPLSASSHPAEYIQTQLDDYERADFSGFIAGQLPSYGLGKANETTINSLAASEDFEFDLVNVTNAETGLHFSTGGNTAVDVILYAYAHGKMGDDLRRYLVGNHDNIEIPRPIEKCLRLDIDEVTKQLREDVSWLV